MYEVYERTHKRKETQQWSGRRSQELGEKFKALASERQESEDSLSVEEQDRIFQEAAGTKYHGSIFGLGNIVSSIKASERIGCSQFSASSSGVTQQQKIECLETQLGEERRQRKEAEQKIEKVETALTLLTQSIEQQLQGVVPGFNLANLTAALLAQPSPPTTAASGHQHSQQEPADDDVGDDEEEYGDDEDECGDDEDDECDNEGY